MTKLESKSEPKQQHDPVLLMVGVGKQLWEREAGDRFIERLRSEDLPPLPFEGLAAEDLNNGSVKESLEVRVGIEPTNKGFADLPLNHLGTAPLKQRYAKNPRSARGQHIWSASRNDFAPVIGPQIVPTPYEDCNWRYGSVQ